jgi:hypothetical protein
VEGFSDTNWVGSSDGKFIARDSMFLGSNLVTWKSKKQTVVTQSSAKAKYRAIAHTASELTLLQYFPLEIGLSAPTSIPFFCDN